MNIIIVSGFLGSGKTTFLQQAIDRFRADRIKFALIINEVGELGIDNELFNMSGENVREILGGCVCCTSAGEFRHALKDIRGSFDPEYVLIEPSGIANPAVILEAVTDCRKETDHIKTIALLDSNRIDLLLEAVYSVTVDTITQAHTVIITKTDIANPEGLETARRFVKSNNPKAGIIEASLINRLEQMTMEALITCKTI